MHPNTKDVTGQRFGRTVVLGDSGQRNKRKVLWRCKCDCGAEFLAMGYLLKNGQVKSCGCVAEEARQRQRVRNAKEKYMVFNPKLNKNNTSGHKGVFWDSQRQKWHAKIKIDGRDHNLCFSDDINDCIRARQLAEEELKETLKERSKT